MNIKYALMIIDAQMNMFDEEMSVFQAEKIIKTMQKLVKKARLNNLLIIWVRNDGGKGEPDESGTYGWKINPILGYNIADIVIDKQNPSAFKNTDLKIILEHNKISHLVIAGMQTEMCINSTVKHAVELGYKVILVEDGHSTFDSKEMKASDVIAKYNKKLSHISKIQKAENIQF
jgi:nicotinamidase-related amidase